MVYERKMNGRNDSRYNKRISGVGNGIRSFGRRLAAALMIGSLIIGSSGCSMQETIEEPTTEAVVFNNYADFEAIVADVPSAITDENGDSKEVELTFWYNDARQAPYYEAAAAEFHDRYGVKIFCDYQNPVDYLDAINEADIQYDGPDVFILSNDQIKKAYLAGLTAKNTLYTDAFWSANYPEVAKKACVTDGHIVGYPIYMDTCMMIYDTELTGKPATFGDITEFAVGFEDETNTKTIFRFDISDPYCDYMYLGDGADVFGEYGENTDEFDVANDAVIQNMTYYQSLRDYFSLEVETSTYDEIKQELKDGTLVYGIVKTDILPELSGYSSSYALCPIPELSDTLTIQNLSTTYAAGVSSYTEHEEYANLFAAYLSYEFTDNLYGLTQSVAVRSSIPHLDVSESSAYEEYKNSVPVPKALENGDFWIYTEICFKNIWNGNDVADEMRKLQTQMELRLQ